MDRPDEIIHVLCESFITVVCEVITLEFIELIVSCFFFFLSSTFPISQLVFFLFPMKCNIL